MIFSFDNNCAVISSFPFSIQMHNGVFFHVRMYYNRDSFVHNNNNNEIKNFLILCMDSFVFNFYYHKSVKYKIKINTNFNKLSFGMQSEINLANELFILIKLHKILEIVSVALDKPFELTIFETLIVFMLVILI